MRATPSYGRLASGSLSDAVSIFDASPPPQNKAQSLSALKVALAGGS